MTNSKNEINLIELTSDFLKFISNKKVLIFSLVFIGLMLGYFKYKSSKMIYENSSIIVSSIESGEILCDVLQSLEIKDKSILAKQLNISVEKANQIKDITFEVIPILSNTLDRPFESRIKMNFIVYNLAIKSDVFKGIDRILKMNSYLNSHFHQYVNKQKEFLAVINLKINELELRSKFNKSSFDGKLNYIETTYVELYEKKQKTENSLNNASIIDFVSVGDFKMIRKPMGLVFSLFIFSVIGFIFSLIFGWMYDFYLKVKNI